MMRIKTPKKEKLGESSRSALHNGLSLDTIEGLAHWVESPTGFDDMCLVFHTLFFFHDWQNPSKSKCYLCNFCLLGVEVEARVRHRRGGDGPHSLEAADLTRGRRRLMVGNRPRSWAAADVTRGREWTSLVGEGGGRGNAYKASRGGGRGRRCLGATARASVSARMEASASEARARHRHGSSKPRSSQGADLTRRRWHQRKSQRYAIFSKVEIGKKTILQGTKTNGLLNTVLTEIYRLKKESSVVENLNLAGVNRAYVCTALSSDRFFTHCALRLKKSGTIVPKMELVEVGPSMNLALRRHRPPNDSLRKEATKTAADKPKKKVG
ncbi:hypothetical protein NL676_009445 [Syzygium grande]|nr:hypothetical protein NL676_009445 [Syzygium grande]